MATQAVIYQQELSQEELERLEYERSKSESPSPANSDCSESDSESSTGSEHEKILMIDPSEHYRPETHGKDMADFRRYTGEEEDKIQNRVRRTYFAMHKNQTVEFVRRKYNEWNKFNRADLTIMEALIKLNDLVDESDPDSDLPNIVHAFQTAERIRKSHPEADWMHLTGLIHDLGKVLAFWGEEQWAVVGDTFVVGCAWPESIVFREESFLENPDAKKPQYQSKYGIYKPNCGLENVMFSSSHDVYLYKVLKNHKACTLPDAGLKMILLHSFYPWHTGGDYMHLCNQDDMQVLPLIREFNKFDLYTKSAPVPDIEALIPYYQSLIDKYIPGKLKW